ncbi:MAG TPA: thioredoxin family protein [Streptosporangiaceae bacterium]|nr:thioredoxin family protein [Streptosporangiaceae bacterium]
MIRIPLYLEIAQWALLLGLGTLLLVLYRQLGRLLSTAAGPQAPGPAVGTKAAPIRYTGVAAGSPARFTPGNGQPALLAFVDPTCPSCEQLVANLSELQAASELGGVRVLLLMSDPPGYLGISPAFQATSLEIGRPLAAGEVSAYHVTGTPLLVAIDGDGIVRAVAVTSKLAEVRAHAATIVRESEAAL